jgi:hypothetical protein
MSQTASAHGQYANPDQIQIAEQAERGGLWSWRAALLLIFAWCVFVWTGIGFFIAL